MTALLHNVSVVHNKNQIRIADGGKAVGDDKACAAFHQTDHGLLDQHLDAGIDRTGCFVENSIFLDRRGLRGRLQWSAIL